MPYTRGVLGHVDGDATATREIGRAGAGRRRSSTPSETARRKAWGQRWGKVGHDWKQTNNPKG